MSDEMTKLEAPEGLGGSIRIRWTPERCPVCFQIGTCDKIRSRLTGDEQWFCYANARQRN